MTISPEAKNMMQLFTMFQHMGILSREEEFNMYYVRIARVEEYAEKYKSRTVSQFEEYVGDDSRHGSYEQCRLPDNVGN